MPSNPTLLVVAPYTMCDNLPTTLAIMYADHWWVFLVVIVRLLQVRPQFHERAGRKRVVLRW